MAFSRYLICSRVLAGGSLEFPGYPKVEVTCDRAQALRLFDRWKKQAAAALAATRSIPLDDPQIHLFDPRLRGPDFVRATLVVGLPSKVRSWEQFLLWASRSAVSRDEVGDRILCHCACMVCEGIETELSVEQIFAWVKPGARLPGVRG